MTFEPYKPEPWSAAVKDNSIVAFAAGIEADQAAVGTAIVEPRSCCQVEGQINCPKLVKRQICGRAKFALFNECRLAA